MSVNKIKISALSEVTSSDATTVVPVSTGSVLATRKITANNLIKNTATITSLTSRVSNLESGGGGGSMSGYAELRAKYQIYLMRTHLMKQFLLITGGF